MNACMPRIMVMENHKTFNFPLATDEDSMPKWLTYIVISNPAWSCGHMA
jgi:hypothetical protein